MNSIYINAATERIDAGALFDRKKVEVSKFVLLQPQTPNFKNSLFENHDVKKTRNKKTSVQRNCRP